MKKILCILLAVLILLIGVAAGVGIYFLKSPQYALLQISKDVKESGLDGLMPHLTEEAEDTVKKITSIAENELLNSFLSLLNKDDYAGVLKSNLKEVEWELKDILKSKQNTDVVLEFNYKEKLVGTIEIKMTKEDSEWKICGVSYPDFDKIDF